MRIIVSGPDSGAGNMALDEALLAASVRDPGLPPVLRIYRWSEPCITIGYFQKSAAFAAANLTVTRRLTGGLAVTHGNDLSYAFIASESHWDAVYRQEETYRRTHAAFLRGLTALGIPAVFADEAAVAGSAAAAICVQRLYRYDLTLNGRKILGSSQRRRGRVLLQQGSIHVHSLLDRFEAAAEALARGFENELSAELRFSVPDMAETAERSRLLDQYRSADWNNRF